MRRRAWALLPWLAGCFPAPIEGAGAGGEATSGSSGSGSAGGVPTSGDAGSASGVGETSTGEASTVTSGGGETGAPGGETTGGAEEQGPRYDEVRQKSAHNSFQRDEALVDMMTVHRVRSLELDVHVGKTLAPDIAGDWYVYHTDIIDAASQCETLSQCAGLVAAVAKVLPEHEVITLWVDLKDGFEEGHRPEDLDAVLVAAFGARLVRPGELVAGCAGATTVQGAVVQCGWPRLAALRGRVLVALTGGGLDAYVAGGAAARAAFVAPGLAAAELAEHPEAAIVNVEQGDVAVATAARAMGLVSRVWTIDDAGAWDGAVMAGAHHLATNKVSAWADPWATTASAGGWPFTCIDACEAPATEAGQVLRVDVASGDLWEESDDAVLVRWPLAGAVMMTGFFGAVSSHVEKFVKGCVGARAGVGAGAAYFAVCRPADDEPLRVQVRAAAGAGTEEIAMADVDGLATEVPGFVRFERDADGLCARGFGSADGVVFVKIAERCFDAPLTEVGVMASGHGSAATVWVFGLATQDGALLAADAAVVLLGGAVGGASDSL